MTPEDFAKTFAALFASRDATGIAGLLDQAAQVVSLTGGSADNRQDAHALFEQEFAGIFAAARLVTGRSRVQVLGPGAVVLHQTFVVTGAFGPDASLLPRFPALVSAVLIARAEGWHAVSLTLSPLSQ